MGRLTHTVSGSIATVRSPAVAPIESLKVHFSPIQEGTGDPSPSNVRPITGWTGVNATKVRSIWDGRYEAGYINDSGIDSNVYLTSKRNIGYISVLGGSKIVFKYKKTENVQVANIMFHEYNSNKEFLGQKWAAPNTEYTLKSATSFIRFHMDANYAPTYNGKDLVVYIKEEAETIPVTFPAVGKNLFNKDAEPYQTGKYITDSVSGIPQYSNNAVYNVYRIPIKPATTYTFGPIKGGSSGSGPIWATMNANGITTRYIFNAGGSEGKYHTFTSYSSDAYLLLSVAVTNDYGYKCDDILQLEEGSSATTYEAFDNTIYGGYVDLATGDVYKEYKRIVYDGSEDENWGKLTSGSATAFGMYMGASDKEKALYSDISSNYLKTISHNATWGNYDNWISDNVSEIATGIQSITTVSAWKEYLSEHNLVVCYKLKTPLKIATLTPQELATFKGYSNFWSNAGDVDVTYQVVESSEMTKERQKIFAGNAPTIHIASGSVANFNMAPGLNRNLKSCKVGFLPVQEGSGDPFPPINQNGSIVGVNNLHNESELSSFKIHFSPIQSGSGDPSPTNVRPITGWTGVTGYKGGKNLLEYPVFWLQAGLSPVNENTFFIKAGTYKLSLSIANATTWRIGILTKTLNGELTGQDNEYLPVIDNMNLGWYTHHWGQVSDNQKTEYTVVIPRDCYIRFMLHSGDTSASTTITNGQLEVGSVATSYESYSAPTSYPVSWESQGTVYGGYVDLVSGDVYKTHEIVDLGTLNYTYDSTAEQFVCYSGITFGDRDSFICSNYKTQSVVTYWTEMVDKTISGHSTDHSVFRIKDTDYADAAAFKAAMDGVKLTYELITPVKVGTISPTSISLTNGAVHSFWSNANAVTIETAGNVRPIKGWGKLNICSSKQNIFDPNELTTININGSNRNAVAYTSPGTYKLKAYGSGTEAYLSGIVKNYDGTWSSVYYVVGNTYAQNMSITIVNGQTLYVYDMQNSPKETSISRFVSWQFQVSLGNSFLDSYESYSGSKYSIEFPLQGKNLFDEKYPNMPSENTTNVYYRHYYVGDGNVIASSDIPLSSSIYGNLFMLPGKVTTGVSTAINDVLIGRSRVITPVDGYITIAYRSYSNVDPRKYHVMIERAAEGQTTPSKYEPMQTLCGGYVNLVTGEVWKTHQFVENSTKVNTMFNGQSIGYWHTTAGELGVTNISGLNNGLKCERLSVVQNTTENDTLEVMSFYSNGIIRWKEKWGMSLADYRIYLADHPLRFVYELATPQLVTTLTPTQIQALKGTNNILSDANGIIEVKYWSH